ncbi:hypothetical protein [Deinococcus sp. Arct2-2]|nr:hypothetical protein [Deinococcus sp. Arct2-2]
MLRTKLPHHSGVPALLYVLPDRCLPLQFILPASVQALRHWDRQLD